MKKKLLTMITSIAVAISVTLCVAGCGENLKGERVDAAGWKSAIDAAYSAILEEKNVTMVCEISDSVSSGEYVLKLDSVNKRAEILFEGEKINGEKITGHAYLENDVMYESDIENNDWIAYPCSFDNSEIGRVCHYIYQIYHIVFNNLNIICFYSIAEYDESNNVYKFDLPESLDYYECLNYVDAAERDKFDEINYFSGGYLFAGEREVTIADGKLRKINYKYTGEKEEWHNGEDITITLKDYGKTKVEPVPQSVKDAVKN